MSVRTSCFTRSAKMSFDDTHFTHFQLPSSILHRLCSAPYVRDCHSIGGHGGAETHALAEVSLTSQVRKNVWAS